VDRLESKRNQSPIHNFIEDDQKHSVPRRCNLRLSFIRTFWTCCFAFKVPCSFVSSIAVLRPTYLLCWSAHADEIGRQ
jgi:hypothetical protein